VNLQDQVRSWPTPNASDGTKGADQIFGRGNLNLPAEASRWPTPDAFISNDGEEPQTFFARQARQKAKGINGNGMGWPTPTANDWKGSGPTLERADGQMRGHRLDYATEQLWSTPRTTDAEKGGPQQSFGAGGKPPPSPATQWMTPRAHESGDYQYQGGDKTKPVPTLTGQANSASALRAPEISTDGEESSPARRNLNPLFVEWLMMWPSGWTLLALTPPASSGSACSATALCRWKARMRSELSRLGSPAPAPPAQIDFFA
jgi:hypothetical protein